jgi:hypothetical protein
MFLANPNATTGCGGRWVEQFMGLLLHQLQQGPQAGGELEFRLTEQARQACG